MYIQIDDIKNAPEQSLRIEFEDVIKELDEENPIYADITFSILGNIITATGKISGEIKSTCVRCLKEFNRKININLDEKFMLGNLFNGMDGEIELKENNFIEELGDKKEIEIEDLIYQSVILNSPNQIVCDINCLGDEIIEKYVKKEISDPRLEVFKNIKLEKDN